MRINFVSVQGTPQELKRMPGLVRFVAKRAAGGPQAARRRGAGQGRGQRPAGGGRRAGRGQRPAGGRGRG
jgi:hypothetical protein